MVKQQMPLEKYRSDDLSYILGREKKIAINYFIAHDDFPMGYEELMISRSKQAVTQGLEELRGEFMGRYHKYYRKNGKELYFMNQHIMPIFREHSKFYQRYSNVPVPEMLRLHGFIVDEMPIDEADIVYMEEYKILYLKWGLLLMKYLLRRNLLRNTFFMAV